MELEFVVYGTPVPQGSTRAFIPKGWKRPIITAANSKTKPWRQEIAGGALAAMENLKITGGHQGPFRVSALFFFNHPKSGKAEQKTTKPDLDKLARSLLDALTGIVFCDDSQVVRLDVAKAFGDPARVVVTVESL